MIVYGSHLSQPTRFVLWTAALVGKQVDFKKVDAGAGEHRTAEFLRLNPNAVFPVLQEKDFVVYESNAIARYLAGDNSSLYPKDPKTRAIVDQWLEWKHGALRQGLAGIVRRRVMKNLMKDYSKHSMAQVFVEVNEEREARQVIEALTVLENQLKSTNRFIVPNMNEPTLADLAIFEEVDQFRLLPAAEEPPFGSNIAAKFPNVDAWTKRLRQIPHYKEVHKELNGAVAKVEQMRQKKAASKL